MSLACRHPIGARVYLLALATGCCALVGYNAHVFLGWQDWLEPLSIAAYGVGGFVSSLAAVKFLADD